MLGFNDQRRKRSQKKNKINFFNKFPIEKNRKKTINWGEWSIKSNNNSNKYYTAFIHCIIKFTFFSSFTGTWRGRPARLPGALHCEWDGEPLRPLRSRLLLQSSQSGSHLLQPAERRQSAHCSRNGSLPHRLRSQFNG